MRCIWITGRSGAGKTTLGDALGHCLPNVYRLDGDDLRLGLCKDLGFSEADRKENIRRAGHVAELISRDRRTLVVASFISPQLEMRRYVRALFAPDEYLEVCVYASEAICRARDPKGLYKGGAVQAPYESGEHDLLIPTELTTVQQSMRAVLTRMGVAA